MNKEPFTPCPICNGVDISFLIHSKDYALTKGFTFDWTSDKAMSNNSSIFKTVKTLANELERQSSK